MKTAAAAALLLAAPIASADTQRMILSGIVTQTHATSGLFSSLSIGDEWTLEVTFDRTTETNWGPVMTTAADGGWALSMGMVDYDITTVSSLVFSANGQTFEPDLSLPATPGIYPVYSLFQPHSFNSVWRQFDLAIYDETPPTNPSLMNLNLNFEQSWRPFSPFIGIGTVNGLSEDALDTWLPQNLFGPTADGERWARMGFAGTQFDGIITGYTHGSYVGRAVPAPSALLAFGALGLTAARRRR